jgi:hypothetical protein
MRNQGYIGQKYLQSKNMDAFYCGLFSVVKPSNGFIDTALLQWAFGLPGRGIRDNLRLWPKSFCAPSANPRSTSANVQDTAVCARRSSMCACAKTVFIIAGPAGNPVTFRRNTRTRIDPSGHRETRTSGHREIETSGNRKIRFTRLARSDSPMSGCSDVPIS